MATAPLFVGATNAAASGTSVSVSRANLLDSGGNPVGVVQGDLLVSVFQSSRGADTITLPSGFAILEDLTVGGVSSIRLVIAWKRVGPSEPSSYTWTSSTGANLTVMLAAYSGADDPVPSDGLASDTSASTVDAPSVAAADADSRVLVVGAIRALATVSTPTGTTSRASAQGVTSNASRLADFTSAAGATGAKTFTFGTSAGRAAATVVLPPSNDPPNAPTLTSPTGGAVVDAAADLDLQGTFSDPDSGDTLSEVTVQHRQVGGLSTTVVQSASGTSFTGTLTGGRSAGAKEWRAKTKDAAGLEGPYSSWAQWTDGTTPAAPVITAPSGTIGTDPSLTEWSAPNQDAFEVEVWSGAGGTGTQHHDSGTVVSSSRSYSTPRPVTGRTEYTRVRVRFAGLWSDWAETSNPVAYTPPSTPTVVVRPNVADEPAAGWEAGAALAVDITNPAGTTAVTHNRVRRQQSVDGGTTWTDTVNGRPGTVDAYNTVALDVAEDGTFVDVGVASRALYRYAAVAVGDNTTETVGGWTL